MRKKPKKEWVFEFNSSYMWGKLHHPILHPNVGKDEWKTVYRSEYPPAKIDAPIKPRLYTLKEAVKELTHASDRIKNYRYQIRNVETGEVIPMEIFS